MAVLKNGPNGGFSGKVGSVVGYRWKNLDVIRGLPRKSRKPRSEARLANEQAMKVIMDVLKPLKLLIRKGFGAAAEPLNMSAFNLALSYNKKNAVTGAYPDLTVDWDRLRISQGDLAGITDMQAAWTADGLSVRWSDAPAGVPAHPQDQLWVVVYLPQKHVWWPFFNVAARQTGACRLPISGNGSPTDAHVLAFFVAYTGDAVSDSVHRFVAVGD